MLNYTSKGPCNFISEYNIFTVNVIRRLSAGMSCHLDAAKGGPQKQSFNSFSALGVFSIV